MAPANVFYNEDDLNALNRCFDYLHKIIDSLLNTLGYKNSMFRSDVFDTCSMYLYQKFCEKAYIPHMVAFRSMVKVSIYNAISKRLKYAKETRRNIQDYYYMRYRDIKYKRSFSYSEENRMDGVRTPLLEGACSITTSSQENITKKNKRIKVLVMYLAVNSKSV